MPVKTFTNDFPFEIRSKIYLECSKFTILCLKMTTHGLTSDRYWGVQIFEIDTNTDYDIDVSLWSGIASGLAYTSRQVRSEFLKQLPYKSTLYVYTRQSRFPLPKEIRYAVPAGLGDKIRSIKFTGHSTGLCLFLPKIRYIFPAVRKVVVFEQSVSTPLALLAGAHLYGHVPMALPPDTQARFRASPAVHLYGYSVTANRLAVSTSQQKEEVVRKLASGFNPQFRQLNQALKETGCFLVMDIRITQYSGGGGNYGEQPEAVTKDVWTTQLVREKDPHEIVLTLLHSDDRLDFFA